MNEELLEKIKGEMKENLDSLSFDNLDTQKKLFKKYWSLCEQLKEIVEFRAEHSIENKSYLLNEEEEQELKEDGTATLIEDNELSTEELIEEDNLEEVNIEAPTYLFERKLRGGFIPDISGFVPEGTVRRLGLEHGDTVRARLKEQDEFHKFYHYELVEKGDGIDAPGRSQYNYCVVKSVAGRFAVDKSEETGKYIRNSEELYTVLLDEQDVQEHQIREGAIIDIAFYQSTPQKAKVLWNHKIEELPEMNEKKSTFKKKTEKELEEPIEQSLVGRTILLIGDEANRNHYEEAVCSRGGTLLTADAKDKFNRIEPLVKKSDLVIFLLSVSGHIGGEHIKQMCRDYDVPFETKWGLGFSGVIRLAEEKFSEVS